MSDTCAVEECGRPVKSLGWCNRHYRRWIRYGDVNVVRPTRPAPGTCVADAVCAVDECEVQARCKGYCAKHYARLKSHGDALWTPPIMPTVCTVEGCDGEVSSRGWCHKHYTRWLRHDDPLSVAYIQGDDDARFLSKIVVAENGCRHWTDKLNHAGYGTFGIGASEHWLAHRWAYTRWVGPIPDGWNVDHLCHNADPTCTVPALCLHRRCVWTEHLGLEPTVAANVANSPNAEWRRTRCPQGHPYSGDNLYISGEGKRQCRACNRVLSRDNARRKKAGQPGGTHCPEGHAFYPDNFYVAPAGWLNCKLCGVGRKRWAGRPPGEG